MNVDEIDSNLDTLMPENVSDGTNLHPANAIKQLQGPVFNAKKGQMWSGYYIFYLIVGALSMQWLLKGTMPALYMLF